MNRKLINIFDISGKSILWGQLDSELINEFINNNIDKESDIIEFNLKGINSIDDFFISIVFINLINTLKYDERAPIIVFSDLHTDEILLSLDRAFKKNKYFSLIRINNEYDIIGNTSYIKKLLLNNIRKGKKSRPSVISELVGKPYSTFVYEFNEFVRCGLLQKENENEFVPSFSIDY